MFRLLPLHGGKPVVVADIGGGSVGFAVVVRNKTGPASVLRALRSVLPYEERTTAQTIALIASTLTETGEKVLSSYASGADNAGVPESVIVILRSPWANSETTQATVSMKTEISITQKLVEKAARDGIAKTSGIDQKRLFESGIVRLELNGYPVTRPKGLFAKELSVTLMLSEANEKMKESILHAIGRLLPGRDIQWRSGTRASTTVLRKRIESRRNYILVDIGSAAATFSVIKRDAIVKHAENKAGTRRILSLMNPKGIPEETLSLLRMISNETGTSEAGTALAASISAIEPELVKMFGDTLAALSTPTRLPNSMILSTHPDIADWLSQFFCRLDFSQFTTTTKPFSVIPLTPAHLEPEVKFKPGSTPDTGIAIGAALVNIPGAS